jgi:hypothetical protein
MDRLVRCEDCGHPGGPMSDGTWEGDPPRDTDRARAFCGQRALEEIRSGNVTPGLPVVHYSPCDEGCRHGGEHGTVRISNPTESAGYTACGVVGFVADIPARRSRVDERERRGIVAPGRHPDTGLATRPSTRATRGALPALFRGALRSMTAGTA